jgi:hypothetical protein
MSKTSNIIAKIKELFAEEKFATDYTAATGEIIRCMGNGLSVGEKVEQVIGGIGTNLPDGNYLLDEGKSIVVAAGEIKEINQPDATSDKPNEVYMETESEMIEEAKDMMGDYKMEIDTKLEDGTEVKVLAKGEAISVGDEVLVKDAEGTFVKPPSGQHKLEGGLTIYTDAEGFINELETEETEKEDEAENEELKTMFEAVSTIKSIVDELRSTIKDLKDENTELKNRFNKFAAEPSAQTIVKKPETLSKTAKIEDKLKFFAKR